MPKESRKDKSEHLIVWNHDGPDLLLAGRCGGCGGAGRFFLPNGEHLDCAECLGYGWFGINPRMPVQAAPGTTEKVAMLTARYASGIPLWNERDGWDTDPRAKQKTSQDQLRYSSPVPAQLQALEDDDFLLEEAEFSEPMAANMAP